MKYYLTQAGRELLSERVKTTIDLTPRHGQSPAASVQSTSNRQFLKDRQSSQHLHKERMAKIKGGITDPRALRGLPPVETEVKPILKTGNKK